jgi:hypothetical protein
MNSAYNQDMGFQGGPFKSGSDLCHPINEKEYYNTHYSKQEFSGNGGASKASKASKSKKVLVVEAKYGKVTTKYITKKEADKHMKERHVRYDKPIKKKKSKKGGSGNASENYASFLEGSYSPYNSSYKQEKCGENKMNGGGEMDNYNGKLASGMGNMGSIMGVAKKVTSGGGSLCGCGSSLNNELTKESMYNGIDNKYGGKNRRKLKGGVYGDVQTEDGEQVGYDNKVNTDPKFEEAGKQSGGKNRRKLKGGNDNDADNNIYTEDGEQVGYDNKVNTDPKFEEAGKQSGGKNRRKLKGGINYARTLTGDDKVNNKVFNKLNGQLNGGKNIKCKYNKKYNGGNDSAGVGSDYVLTHGSRGPSNYPDEKSAELFRFFNKTSEFIPNSQLKYAATPILSGTVPDEYAYPLAYNDDSSFVGGKSLKKPAAKKPAAKKPAAKKPAAKKPAAKKPAAKKPAAKKPAAKKPAAKKSYI